MPRETSLQRTPHTANDEPLIAEDPEGTGTFTGATSSGVDAVGSRVGSIDSATGAMGSALGTLANNGTCGVELLPSSVEEASIPATGFDTEDVELGSDRALPQAITPQAQPVSDGTASTPTSAALPTGAAADPGTVGAHGDDVQDAPTTETTADETPAETAAPVVGQQHPAFRSGRAAPSLLTEGETGVDFTAAAGPMLSPLELPTVPAPIVGTSPEAPFTAGVAEEFGSRSGEGRAPTGGPVYRRPQYR